MNKGFTLIECILCLVLLGIIGVCFTQGAVQILQIKASRSAFMESIPMIDSEISAIRHALRYDSSPPGYTCSEQKVNSDLLQCSMTAGEKTVLLQYSITAGGEEPDLLQCSITAGGETTVFFVARATHHAIPPSNP